MKTLSKIFLIIFGTIILIGLGLFLTWYIPHLITKSDIQKEFNQIPIYSESGECGSNRYIDPFIDIMGVGEQQQCKYSLYLTGHETRDKYKEFLTSNGWTCFSISIGKSKYFKGKYRLVSSIDKGYHSGEYDTGWLSLYDEGAESLKELKEKNPEIYNCD